MSHPPLPPRSPARRRKRPQAEEARPRVQWVYVEPTLPPMLTAEEIAALNAADAAAAEARLRRCVPHRPKQCRISESFYQRGNRKVPYIRLRGGWLAQAGFLAGGQLRIELKDDSLVLTRLPPEPQEPRRRRHQVPAIRGTQGSRAPRS